MPAISAVPIETMLARFEQAFRARVPFREDGLLGGALCHEVRPVLLSLADHVSADVGMARVETYALLLALGRKAGEMGVTPTAALALREALLDALGRVAAPSEPGRDDLAMVLMEGYCEGRDARVLLELRRSVVEHQVRIPLAPRCHAVLLSGPMEPDALQGLLERTARWCFREESLSVLLDVTQLDARPEEEVARALVEFCLSCQQLGCSVTLVCVDAALESALHELKLRDAGVASYADFDTALSQALKQAGHVIRPISPLLRRLVRR